MAVKGKTEERSFQRAISHTLQALPPLVFVGAGLFHYVGTVVNAFELPSIRSPLLTANNSFFQLRPPPKKKHNQKGGLSAQKDRKSVV